MKQNIKNLAKVLIVTTLLSACLRVQKKDEIKSETLPVAELVEAIPEKELVKVYFSSEINLSQDTEIIADEVYFSADTIIYTNQFNLKINAEKLFFESGSNIQNFSKNLQVALFNTAGLNAGTVRIKANQALGYLSVVMNGQGGGVGKGGWSDGTDVPEIIGRPRSPCTAGSGKSAGQSGSFFIDLQSSDQFFMSYAMNTSLGGPIGHLDTDFRMHLDPEIKNKYKWGNPEDDCGEKSLVGLNGQPGQICMKLKNNEPARCENFN